MKPTLALFLGALVLVLVGCASSKSAGPHPLVGVWNYELEGPNGVDTGIVTFAETEGALSGVAHPDLSAQAVPLENLAFEADVLTFEFDTNEARWKAVLPFEGDTFEGTVATLDGQISGIVLKGKRRAE